MKITYSGHSCLIVEAEGKKVIIDPFLSGNPNSGLDPKDVKVDAVILTHGHGDHFGDALEIAQQNDCEVIGTAEIAGFCQSKGVKAHGMNIGGAFSFDGFRVKLTTAFHSSSIQDGDQVVYLGEPAGILLTMGNKTLYHLGDTALFSDLKMIGELNQIDVAAIPIGDNFTMGPEDALIAAEWIGAKQVIPVHYNTFPVIQQNGNAFADELQQKGITGHALTNGQSVQI